MSPRGWRKSTQPELTVSATEPYPEHAKMYPFFNENWAIGEFCHFMVDNGLVELTFKQVEDALLAFRGVDKLEYEAEAAKLKSEEYRWLWEKFKVDDMGTTPAGRAVKPAVARVVQAALPDKTPDDGLGFLLDRIRGGRDGQGDES